MDHYQKLQTLLSDPETTEIMINGSDRVFIEKKGKKVKVDMRFNSDEEVVELINYMFAQRNKKLTSQRPMGDVCLKDGSRVNAVLPPVSVNGPSVTIRKFSEEIKSMDDLVRTNTLSPKAAQFLLASVKGRLNILFSGATGVGKTVTMEMLSYHIAPEERIVTVEDTAELKLHHLNMVSLEAQQAGDAGGEVTLRDLVKNSLRMRPNRIILGEIRGDECIDFIQAMSTGHRGTFGVVHGNSPAEVLARIEAMILMTGVSLSLPDVRRMIVNTLDIVVQQEMLPDGSRHITHIAEVRDVERGEILVQDLFTFRVKKINEDGTIVGGLRPSMKAYPKFFVKFQREGLLDDQVFVDDETDLVE